MGKMIEQIALDRGHSIVAKIDIDTEHVDFENMDVAIDFSMPNAAFGNITSCFEHGGSGNFRNDGLVGSF